MCLDSYVGIKKKLPLCPVHVIGPLPPAMQKGLLAEWLRLSARLEDLLDNAIMMGQVPGRLDSLE